MGKQKGSQRTEERGGEGIEGEYENQTHHICLSDNQNERNAHC